MADDVRTDREYDVLAKQRVHARPERGGRTSRFSRNRDPSLWSPRLPCLIRQSPASGYRTWRGRLGHRGPNGAGRRGTGIFPMRTNLASHRPSGGQRETLPTASKSSTSKITPPTMAGTSSVQPKNINWSPGGPPTKQIRQARLNVSFDTTSGQPKRLLPAIRRHIRLTGLSDPGEPLWRPTLRLSLDVQRLGPS